MKRIVLIDDDNVITELQELEYGVYQVSILRQGKYEKCIDFQINQEGWIYINGEREVMDSVKRYTFQNHTLACGVWVGGECNCDPEGQNERT